MGRRNYLRGSYDWKRVKPESFPDQRSFDRWRQWVETNTWTFHQNKAENSYYRSEHKNAHLFHLLPALELRGPWTPAHDGGCPHETWNNQFGSVQFTCEYWIFFAPNYRQLRAVCPFGTNRFALIRSFGSSGNKEYFSFLANDHYRFGLTLEQKKEEQDAHMHLFSRWVDEYRRHGDQPEWLAGLDDGSDDEVSDSYRLRLKRVIDATLEDRARSHRWQTRDRIIRPRPHYSLLLSSEDQVEP